MNKLNGYTDPKNTSVLSSHKLQNNKGFCVCQAAQNSDLPQDSESGEWYWSTSSSTGLIRSLFCDLWPISNRHFYGRVQNESANK